MFNTFESSAISEILSQYTLSNKCSVSTDYIRPIACLLDSLRNVMAEVNKVTSLAMMCCSDL